MQAALTALALRPQASKLLLQHTELCNLFLEQFRFVRFAVFTNHGACKLNHIACSRQILNLVRCNIIQTHCGKNHNFVTKLALMNVKSVVQFWHADKPY